MKTFYTRGMNKCIYSPSEHNHPVPTAPTGCTKHWNLQPLSRSTCGRSQQVICLRYTCVSSILFIYLLTTKCPKVDMFGQQLDKNHSLSRYSSGCAPPSSTWSASNVGCATLTFFTSSVYLCKNVKECFIFYKSNQKGF